MDNYSSAAEWFEEGRLAPYVEAMKSQGTILDLIGAALPAGDVSQPAVPDLVLVQQVVPSNQVWGNMGWGRYDQRGEKGKFFLAAPNFATTIWGDSANSFRGLAFPLAEWQTVFDEAADGKVSIESLNIERGLFHSPNIRLAMSKLWGLSADEGATSRLLARSAGCEILAELCRVSGNSIAPAKGGLAPWVQRRCVDFMYANISEDMTLESLAAEAQLSQFHFARMFKESLGVPPRVYLTRIRMEKACELLHKTNLPVTEIAFDVGYASNQAFARVFLREMNMTPTAYRRSIADASR